MRYQTRKSYKRKAASLAAAVALIASASLVSFSGPADVRAKYVTSAGTSGDLAFSKTITVQFKPTLQLGEEKPASKDDKKYWMPGLTVVNKTATAEKNWAVDAPDITEDCKDNAAASAPEFQTVQNGSETTVYCSAENRYYEFLGWYTYSDFWNLQDAVEYQSNFLTSAVSRTNSADSMYVEVFSKWKEISAEDWKALSPGQSAENNTETGAESQNAALTPDNQNPMAEQAEPAGTAAADASAGTAQQNAGTAAADASAGTAQQNGGSEAASDAGGAVSDSEAPSADETETAAEENQQDEYAAEDGAGAAADDETDEETAGEAR